MEGQCFCTLFLAPFRTSSSVPKAPYEDSKIKEAGEKLLLQCAADSVEMGKLITGFSSWVPWK